MSLNLKMKTCLNIFINVICGVLRKILDLTISPTFMEGAIKYLLIFHVINKMKYLGQAHIL